MKKSILMVAIIATTFQSFAQESDPIYFLDSVTVVDEFEEVLGTSKHLFNDQKNSINSYYNLEPFFFETSLIPQYFFSDTVKMLNDSQYVVGALFFDDEDTTVLRFTYKFKESGKIKTYKVEYFELGLESYLELYRLSILYYENGLVKKIQEREEGYVTKTSNYYLGDDQKMDSVITINDYDEITSIIHFYNHNENFIPTLSVSIATDSREPQDTTYFEYDSLNRLTYLENYYPDKQDKYGNILEVNYTTDGLDQMNIYEGFLKGEFPKMTRKIQRNILKEGDENYLIPFGPQYYFVDFDPITDTNPYNSNFFISYPKPTSSYVIFEPAIGSTSLEKRAEIIFHYDTFKTSTQVQAKVNLDLNFYPNPAKDFITIDGSDKSKIARALVYDYTGKLVKLQKVQNHVMDISNLQVGYYVFHIYDQAGRPVHSETIIKN